MMATAKDKPALPRAGIQQGKQRKAGRKQTIRKNAHMQPQDAIIIAEKQSAQDNSSIVFQGKKCDERTKILFFPQKTLEVWKN